jgi:serine/threonine-protein kinase
MGTVYLARDRNLDENVAIKVLKAEVVRGDPLIAERFKQEIKVTRRITHPNVVRVHDFGQAHGLLFISMEHFKGSNLKAIVRAKGKLSVPVGLKVIQGVIAGLEAAHKLGIIHRDVKPANVVVNAKGRVKVLDFGIARLAGPARNDGMTKTGLVLGSPDYMSPEQCQSEEADARSDVYSLGVMMYEVFTGTVPFRGDNLVKTLLMHMKQKPRPPRQLNPEIPEGLEKVILKCLEKSPERRYQSMVHLLRDLAEL